MAILVEAHFRKNTKESILSRVALYITSVFINQ